MEREWHWRSIKFIVRLQKISITKFSCYSSNKGCRKIGKINIWRVEMDIIFKKNKIIDKFFKNGSSKNFRKLPVNQLRRYFIFTKLHAKSGYVLSIYLTHLFPMHPSFTPWKSQKTLRLFRIWFYLWHTGLYPENCTRSQKTFLHDLNKGLGDAEEHINEFNKVAQAWAHRFVFLKAVLFFLISY